MKHFLAVILILAPLITHSQGNDFTEVDNYVHSLEVPEDISPQDLTAKLTAPFNSDMLKTRAIFCWLATNIRYDGKEKETTYWAKYPSDKARLEDTYRFRKGVCSGISHLFRYMLELAGIRGIVINGYARNDIETIFRQKPNHAWNAVKIDAQWHLFDLTWAIDASKKMNDFWFDTNPELFILNHYPLYQQYTFTGKKFSLGEFYSFPVYCGKFYELDFAEVDFSTGPYTAVNDTVTVHIAPNLNCVLLTKLYDIQNKAWIPSQPGGFTAGKDYFKLYIPGKGDFILKLGALVQDGNSSVVHDDLVYYMIENR